MRAVGFTVGPASETLHKSELEAAARTTDGPPPIATGPGADAARKQWAKTVAEALGVAETTVKSHLGHVFAKTGTSRQVDLAKLVAGDASRWSGEPASVLETWLKHDSCATSSDRRRRRRASGGIVCER